MLGVTVVTLLVATVSLLHLASPLPLKQQQQQLQQQQPQQNPADSCDWTIWDSTWEDRGVRNVYAGCSEGRIEWRAPFGAVRVTLSPSMGHRQPFEGCFLASVQSVSAQISLEKADDLEPLVLLNKTRPEMSTEVCLRSSSQGEELTLYVEAESSMDGMLLGVVVIDYDLQVLPGGSRAKNGDLYQDDMEECRPCTNEELVLAVCSSDFVVQGSISHVLHNHELRETHLHLQADRVIRQQQDIFVQSPVHVPGTSSSSSSSQSASSQQSTSRSSPQLTNSDSSNGSVRLRPGTAVAVADAVDSGVRAEQGGTWTGYVIAPHKCHIHKGSGQFLFVGKVRLKRAVLKCAPRLEDFQEVWEAGARTGDNPCMLE